MWCDPGTRSGLDRIWSPKLPGTEICRTRLVGCTDIPFFRETARPGFEVMDTVNPDELAILTFGLGRLIGNEYPQ
jgi:hypothetical protein